MSRDGIPDALRELKAPSIKDLRSLDESKWEATMVDVTCRRLGIPRSRRDEMVAWTKRIDGDGRLTFGAFNHVVSEFPMFFGCRLISNLSKLVPVSRLFMRFSATAIFRAYTELREHVPIEASGKRLGLVFRWPNLGRAGEQPNALVLHDRPSNQAVAGCQLQIIIQRNSPTGDTIEPLRLWVATLPALLAEIQHDNEWP